MARERSEGREEREDVRPGNPGPPGGPPAPSHETRVAAGKKAAIEAKARYGEEFHSEIGKKGGETRKRQLEGED